MRSDAKKVFYFHADANSLGGFIEKPFQKIIPSQASVSLPAVGGHATTRTEAFNFEGIISCRSAYTRVTGTQVAPDGPWSTTSPRSRRRSPRPSSTTLKNTDARHATRSSPPPA